MPIAWPIASLLRLTAVGFAPVWPVEANLVFVMLPHRLHERLQAAGAHYYVIHTDRTAPATVPPGHVLARLVTSFATTQGDSTSFDRPRKTVAMTPKRRPNRRLVW